MIVVQRALKYNYFGLSGMQGSLYAETGTLITGAEIKAS